MKVICQLDEFNLRQGVKRRSLMAHHEHTTFKKAEINQSERSILLSSAMSLRVRW